MEPPQLYSQPTDPYAPSFLGMPAEIRNSIYGLLFEREGLTLLHNANAFFPREPDLKDYEDDDVKMCRHYGCGYDRTSHWEHDHMAWAVSMCNDEQEMKNLKNDFFHGFSEGLGLLECCRQIHYEASGVFYGHNTFAFSRSTSRHDLNHLSNGYGSWHSTEFYDNEAYSQINFVARWVESIGSHYNFLRKVMIDTDAMCPSQCQRVADYDILPLLRIIWTHPKTKCQIVFGRTGRRLSWYLHPYMDEATDLDLNTVLDTIGQRDMLSLRRVSRSIEKIVVSPKAMNPRHYVVYKRSGARQFIVLDRGARLMWEPQERTPLLSDLPKSIQEKICRYAALAPEGITIDLTAGKTYGIDLAWFRFFRVIQAGYPLTLAMTSRTVSTGFKRFRGLDYLLYPDAVNNGIISNIARGKYGHTWDQSVNLNFMLGRRKDHADIRINIKGLVRFLSSLPLLKSNTWSNINIILYDKKGAYRAKVELPIKKLRKAVFLFFTDLLRKEESQYTTPLYTPNIWVNGSGDIVRCINKPRKFRCAGATSWQFDMNSNGRYVFEAHEESRLAFVAYKIGWRAQAMNGECPIEKRNECLVHAWDDLSRCMEVEWGSLPPAMHRGAFE